MDSSFWKEKKKRRRIAYVYFLKRFICLSWYIFN